MSRNFVTQRALEIPLEMEKLEFLSWLSLTNLTRNREVPDSIPGLAQWVKDLVLL